MSDRCPGRWVVAVLLAVAVAARADDPDALPGARAGEVKAEDARAEEQHRRLQWAQARVLLGREQHEKAEAEAAQQRLQGQWLLAEIQRKAAIQAAERSQPLNREAKASPALLVEWEGLGRYPNRRVR